MDLAAARSWRMWSAGTISSFDEERRRIGSARIGIAALLSHLRRKKSGLKKGTLRNANFESTY